jgi:hypothetical protein
MSASAIIADVLRLLRGTPAFLAGSLVAEETYGKTAAHSDVDLFCPTTTSFMVAGQRLIDTGYTFAPRMERAWYRWVNYGFNSWHTNSLRLMSPAGVETNLVYKLLGKQPCNSLSSVLESFDFGLLATGYETQTGTRRDMRAYLFPAHDPDGPLPLMPNKRDNWRLGFISQYNGLRECGRYAKYHQYGYDLSLVKDDLVTGYYQAADDMSSAFEPEKQQLGLIYDTIAKKIENDEIAELALAAKKIDYKDALDQILEALE